MTVSTWVAVRWLMSPNWNQKDAPLLGAIVVKPWGPKCTRASSPTLTPMLVAIWPMVGAAVAVALGTPKVPTPRGTSPPAKIAIPVGTATATVPANNAPSPVFARVWSLTPTAVAPL